LTATAPRPIMVATLGFTADFILRRVAALRTRSLRKLITAGIYVDKASWRRVEEAYSLVKVFASSVGVETELWRINLPHLVRELRDVIEAAAGQLAAGEQAEVYLTGGPRIAVVSALLASLTVSEAAAEKLVVHVDGEGFDAELEIGVAQLRRLTTLDPYARRLLGALARHPRGATAAQLLMETGMQRSTLYKKLRELLNAGLIEKDDNQYRVNELIRLLL